MEKAGEGKKSGEEDTKREDKGEMLTTGETERGLTLSMARLKLSAQISEAQGKNIITQFTVQS